MKAHVEGTKSLFSPINHSSGTSLTLNCYLFLSEDQACMYTCTSTWVAFSKTCVIAVNIRNLVYYKIYEISHCPQPVELLLKHSIEVVWAADELFIWSW